VKQGIKSFITVSLFVLFLAANGYGQQLKGRWDYGLNGPVKKCTVLTSYGKELYSFTRDGKLEQLISFYDENNYQQISYTYNDSLLVERRIELYEAGQLDQEASVINIYQNDSTAILKREVIVDYKGRTLEELNFSYDSLHQLIEIKKLTKNGQLTTQFSRLKDSLGHYKTTVLIDSVVKRQIDSIPALSMELDSLINVRNVYFLDGIEDRAETVKYDHRANVVYLKNELYLLDSNQWYVEKEEEFEFNEKDQMIKKITKEGTTTFTQNFVYQTDGTQYQNWVKQIVMPNMTYTTRIIEYFEEN
jgi:hypothetical protein